MIRPASLQSVEASKGHRVLPNEVAKELDQMTFVERNFQSSDILAS